MAERVRRCECCGTEGANKCCAACKDTWYCGRECQAKHWKAGHKTKCFKAAAAASKSPSAAAQQQKQPKQQKPKKIVKRRLKIDTSPSGAVPAVEVEQLDA